MSIAPKDRAFRLPYTKFMPATPKPALDSWWTRPDLQGNRAAFQKQLVAVEIDRFNSQSQRFGGSKSTHDKFIGDKR